VLGASLILEGGHGRFCSGRCAEVGGKCSTPASVLARSLSLDGGPDLSQGLFFEEGSEAGERRKGDP
jgi:hypothetical protein